MNLMNEPSPFQDWFSQKFSDWEKLQPGKRSTYTAFAEYLSNNSLGLVIKQQYVSGWRNGEFKPSEKYAPVLAEKLGDEVYALLGFEKPDPQLQLINSRWSHIPPAIQQHIVELSEGFEHTNEKERLQTSPKRTKKTARK